MKEMIQSWKQARLVQIRNLYNRGETREKLEKRFGKWEVSDALDRHKVYH